VAAPIRVGVCSWADETLSKVWYPPGVRSADRLGYYAERFDVVEANSTYYRLPETPMVENWAERTPDGFTMHVKAFGAMTRHPVKIDQLPPDLREEAPSDERGRLFRPSWGFRAEIFRRFREALEPLRDAGKLGGILMQLPPFLVYDQGTLEYLEWAQDQLPGDELLVEFRHASWLDETNRGDVLAFLEQQGMTYVTVDAPQTGGRNVLPTVVAATSGTGYVRFHGRNEKTWNKRTGSAAERFDYLYSTEELRDWVGSLRELAREAHVVYAMFNNNGRSELPELKGLDPEEAAGDPSAGFVAQAPANALMLKGLLAESA
jgi:uncharacterized protein YecE (DUF72 family)